MKRERSRGHTRKQAGRVGDALTQRRVDRRTPQTPPPNEPARPENEPPSVELEEEWKAAVSYNVGLTSGNADASGVPGQVEDSTHLGGLETSHTTLAA